MYVPVSFWNQIFHAHLSGERKDKMGKETEETLPITLL